MKLHQLHEERVDDYIRRLTRTLNIKRLGSGYFSTVFQHPVYHNVAVKLLRDPDPNYIKFLRICEKHQDNPWLPKLIGIHKVGFHDEDHEKADIESDVHGDLLTNIRFIVFFQKLRRARMSEIRAAAEQMVNSVPDAVWYKARHVGEKENYDDFDGFDEDVWTLLSKKSEDQYIRTLASIMLQIGADDIHDANVMMRDDGGKPQLVFTDPVASAM